jgi:hypothetical protein
MAVTLSKRSASVDALVAARRVETESRDLRTDSLCCQFTHTDIIRDISGRRWSSWRPSSSEGSMTR